MTATRSSTRTPSPSAQADPGLHGHHVAGGELVVGGGREARSLVHLEAHAVAEAAPELLAVAGGDPLAGHRVRGTTGHPRTHRLDRGVVSVEDDGVDGGGLLGERAGGEGARAVRAVAVEPTSDIDDDEGPERDVAQDLEQAMRRSS